MRHDFEETPYAPVSMTALQISVAHQNTTSEPPSTVYSSPGAPNVGPRSSRITLRILVWPDANHMVPCLIWIRSEGLKSAVLPPCYEQSRLHHGVRLHEAGDYEIRNTIKIYPSRIDLDMTGSARGCAKMRAILDLVLHILVPFCISVLQMICSC